MRNLLKLVLGILLSFLLASGLQGCAVTNQNTPPAQSPQVSPSQPAVLPPAGTQTAALAGTASLAAQATSGFGTASPTLAMNPGQYAVILIKEGMVLNVRQSPGTSSAVLETLPPQSAGISLTGKTVQQNGDTWVEINRPGGGTGWVNATYVTEYKPASIFCGDAQVTALLEAFKKAILNKDGKQLAGLVSPTHGLTVQYLRDGNTATYTSDKAAWLFSSTYQMDWGQNPASGLEVKASFHDEVLPKLVDVLNTTYIPACDNVQTGGTSYTYQWPFEYGNINFYALYHPATAGNDQTWRTWLVGIEFVNDKPYLFSLVNLYWEP
jgi:hypothetical protein